MAYIDAGVTMVRVNLLSGYGASLAEHIENRLKSVDFEKTGWMVSIGFFTIFWMFCFLIMEMKLHSWLLYNSIYMYISIQKVYTLNHICLKNFWYKSLKFQLFYISKYMYFKHQYIYWVLFCLTRKLNCLVRGFEFCQGHQ